MRAVLQRVVQAAVSVDGQVVGHIGPGLVVLVGVALGDGPTDIQYTASKIRDARIFADDEGRMNRSVADVGGALLLVSQFTLMGDLRKGRRPGFDRAAPPAVARQVYEDLLTTIRSMGLVLEAGRFQSHMRVELVNDGPVTVLLDSRRAF